MYLLLFISYLFLNYRHHFIHALLTRTVPVTSFTRRDIATSMPQQLGTMIKRMAVKFFHFFLFSRGRRRRWVVSFRTNCHLLPCRWRAQRKFVALTLARWNCATCAHIVRVCTTKITWAWTLVCTSIFMKIKCKSTIRLLTSLSMSFTTEVISFSFLRCTSNISHICCGRRTSLTSSLSVLTRLLFPWINVRSIQLVSIHWDLVW